MDAVSIQIREQQPDLVLLQEVWLTVYRNRLERLLSDEYEATFVPRTMTGWPAGGLLVFRRRAVGWSVEEITFTRYDRAASWWRLDEGDGLSGKGYLAIQLLKNSQRLLVVNTHLQSQYPEHAREYEEIRRSQLNQLQSYLSNIPSSQLVLIAGDFNTKPTERLFGSHLDPLGTDLTRAEREESASGTAFNERGESKDWIDYVITRHFDAEADVVLIRNESIDVPYSDHHGLLVRLLYDNGDRTTLCRASEAVVSLTGVSPTSGACMAREMTGVGVTSSPR
jgi:endonuclease/exonuclease/phosphatase family metal-dependent hydrolase